MATRWKNVPLPLLLVKERRVKASSTVRGSSAGRARWQRSFVVATAVRNAL